MTPEIVKYLKGILFSIVCSIWALIVVSTIVSLFVDLPASGVAIITLCIGACISTQYRKYEIFAFLMFTVICTYVLVYLVEWLKSFH